MRNRAINFLTPNNIYALLVGCIILGVLVGVQTSSWQYAIENAQHLLGIVRFSDKNLLPNFYFNQLFSLTNFIAFFLIKIFGSEVLSSIVLSIFIAILATLVIGLISFLLTRNFLFSLLITAFIVLWNFYGEGINYPVLLIGSSHTHGRMGVLVILFAAILFAYENNKTAFFLTALSIGFHPIWGLWLNGVIFIILVFKFDQYKYLLCKKNLGWYLFGMMVVALFYAYHKILRQDFITILPSLDLNSNKELLKNYITYFDFHRKKIDDLNIIFRTFAYSLISVSIGVLFLRLSNLKNIKLFFLIIIIGSILSWPLVFIPSWFSPELFPDFFVFAMPGRLINLSIIPATVLIISIFFNKYLIIKKYEYPMLVLCLLFVIYDQVSRHPVQKFSLDYLWLILFFTIFLAILFIRLFYKYIYIYLFIYISFLIICILCIPFAAKRSPDKLFERLSQEESLVSNVFKGQTILTSDSGSLLSLAYRLPTITPNMTYYSFNMQSLFAGQQFLRDLYGLDIGIQPSNNHLPGITKEDIFPFWAAKTCDDWQKLSQKYGFSLVETDSKTSLKLKKISENSKYKIYSIECNDANLFAAEKEITYQNFLASGYLDCTTCEDDKTDILSKKSVAPVDLNEQIYFSRGSIGVNYLVNIGAYLRSGWGWAFPEAWGVWSEGNKAKIVIPLTANTWPKALLIKLQAFIVPLKNTQTVEIFINGLLIKSLIINDSSIKEIKLFIPEWLQNDKFMSIEFYTPNATSPKTLNISDDTRELGVGLVEISFTRDNGI